MELPVENLPSAAAMELLGKGVEQEVQIPLRYLLVAVMEGIKSPSPPVFSCSQLPDGSGFKAKIQLDVSTLVKSDPEVLVKEVEGVVCTNPELAISSAVEEALLYLANKQFVRVKDHSNKVADRYPVFENCGSVNSVSSGLEKSFESFNNALRSFDKLRMDFEVNEKAQTRNSVSTPFALIYGELSKELKDRLEEQLNNYRLLKLQFDECQSVRKKHHEESNNLSREWRLKGYYQVAQVSEKAVLGYLLSHLGMDAAIYGSEYDEEGGYTGRVTLNVPDLKFADCHGMISMSGIRSFNSHDAEDEAAYNGLNFLEHKLKVKAVDLNYSERISAKKTNDLLVNLLECYLVLVDKVRNGWKHLNYVLDETCKYYESDYKFIMEGKLSESQIAKLDNCIKEMRELYVESAKGYEVTAGKLNQLQDYNPRRI